MEFYNILLGLILLVFGRKLFWLFVAIAGFLVGMEFTRVILADLPRWILVVVALGAGLVGALLVVMAERVAFALAGFLAGSYFAVILAHSLGATGNNILLFAVGGVIGAVFAALIMNRAIIFLSCLVGAAAVVKGLGLGQEMSSFVFVVLVILGALVQTRLMKRSRQS